jgi:D-threo-aldose 1-dehydrogenase
MKLIPLASTGRKTTQLGFGCAFPTSMTKHDALRLMDAAFDAGIRHFDVAPYYADGAAEGYVGDFLARHAGEVTVTTKFGLLPPSPRPLHIRVARTLLGPAVRALRRRIPSVPKSSAGISAKSVFTAEAARRSLDNSLRLLHLDTIDVFLMHEPTVADLADEQLLQFLKDSVAGKRIGVFGIGGDSSRVPGLYNQRRQFCNIMQFDWSALSPESDWVFPGSFQIHYWVFTQKHTPTHAHTLQALHAALLKRSAFCDQWSRQIDLDIGDIRNLSALMLKAALMQFPDSGVLFTSSKPENILRNVGLAGDAAWEENARRFRKLVAREGALLPSELT